MRAREMQQMTDEELEAKLAEMSEERFRLRFRGATEAIENPIRFRAIRRDIARLQTILRARRRGA
ncbi:MAG: 50S ribosomal protein L29 [Gemmatimonadota bacterium]|jgi:large subunit ribosomal protein L29|nr:50S ribosomal protein L29 [Gemmatimonadota bacterium]